MSSQAHMVQSDTPGDEDPKKCQSVIPPRAYDSASTATLKTTYVLQMGTDFTSKASESWGKKSQIQKH